MIEEVELAIFIHLFKNQGVSGYGVKRRLFQRHFDLLGKVLMKATGTVAILDLVRSGTGLTS